MIAQVSTQEGETVSAGLNAPTFVTLIDLERLEVAAYVDEVDVGRIRVGQRATFSVDAFPGEEFTGTVTAIYPRAVIQSNVVNYITTVAIENPDGKLKPDMTANVTIVARRAQGRPGRAGQGAAARARADGRVRGRRRRRRRRAARGEGRAARRRDGGDRLRPRRGRAVCQILEGEKR